MHESLAFIGLARSLPTAAIYAGHVNDGGIVDGDCNTSLVWPVPDGPTGVQEAVTPDALYAMRFCSKAPIPLSIPLIFERFRADFGQFLRDFGMIAVQGIVVWCIAAPLIVAAIYFSTRPLLRRLARRTA